MLLRRLACAVTQVLGQVAFPLAASGRMRRMEGSSDESASSRAAAVVATLATAGGYWWWRQPAARSVHRAAGVTRDRSSSTAASGSSATAEEPRAQYRRGRGERRRTVKNVTNVGGENGVEVDGFYDVVLDGVTVSGFLSSTVIDVRRSAVTIQNCAIDALGRAYAQGIDISYAMDKGEEPRLWAVRVVGGQEGIVTHFFQRAG